VAVTAGFVSGIGAAAATPGVLSQLKGRIFALLYLTPERLSLDQIADELQQSKSNISVNIPAGSWNGRKEYCADSFRPESWPSCLFPVLRIQASHEWRPLPKGASPVPSQIRHSAWRQAAP